MATPTLFVGNLSFQSTEESLRAAFHGCTAARIPLGDGGRSRGFGLVDFPTAEAAAAAKAAMAETEIDGRKVNIDFAQPRAPRSSPTQSAPREPRNAPSSTLYVRNLAYEATQAQVAAVFAPYRVKEVRLMSDRDGRSRGFGYAEFHSVEDARRALNEKNNTEVAGRNIGLDFAEPPRERASPPQRSPTMPTHAPSDTLFLGGLAYSSTEDSIRRAFAACRGIVSVRIAIDPQGQAKGFGYLQFDSVANAQAAMVMNGANVDGRAIRLDFAEPQKPREPREPRAPRPVAAPTAAPTPKLYVGGLSFNTTTPALKAAFERYGTVTDAIVMIDRATHRSKGFGYVTFASQEEATAALTAMNGQQLDERQIRLDYANPAPPKPRTERPQHDREEKPDTRRRGRR